MIIETKVDVNPTIDELADYIMEDQNNRFPRLLYEICINHGWDERKTANIIRANDYMDDLETMIFKLDELLHYLKHKERTPEKVTDSPLIVK